MHCFKYPQFVGDKYKHCDVHGFFETTVVTTQLEISLSGLLGVVRLCSILLC
jgi:hypothetical protein